MTYIKFEHRALGHPKWLDVSPAAFTLHVWALDYCNEQATDGVIPDRILVRLVCPVEPVAIPGALAELEAVGEWVRSERGWVCPNFLAHGLPAEEQNATRARWAEDKRRRRLCGNGVHQLCTPRSKCPVVGRKPNAADSRPSGRGTESSKSGRPYPTRPNPLRGFWEGDGEEPPADAGRPAQEEPPASPWLPVGDCPHAPRGRDTLIAFPDRIRCKDCAKAEKARATAEARAAARAELKQVATGDAS